MAAEQSYVDSWLGARAAKEQAYLEGLATPDGTDFSQTIGGLPFMGLNRPETFIDDKPNEYNFPRITPQLEIKRTPFLKQATLRSPNRQLRDEYDRLEDQAGWYADLEHQTQDPNLEDFAHDIKMMIFKHMDEIELEEQQRRRDRLAGVSGEFRGRGLAYKGKKHGFIRSKMSR